MSDKDPASHSRQETDLDDLDTFLDDFGKEARTTADEAEPLIVEMENERPLLDGDTAVEVSDAHAEELPELSVADAVPAAELDLGADLAEEEAPRFGSSAPADEFDDFPPDPVPAATHSGQATTQEGITIMAAEDEAPIMAKRGLDVSIGGLALFALLVAGGAVWYALSLQGQLTELRSELAQSRQPAAFASGPDLQMQEELGRLNQRLNEMALKLDGPLGQLSESNQRELADIFSRMDGFEKAVTELREDIAGLQRSGKSTTAKTEPKPVTKTVQPQAAPKPSTATTSKTGRTGNWVVNVASLTDGKAAIAEQQRLKKEGIEVEVQEVVMSGRTWYRVRATGFASREEAQVYGDILREHVKTTPWVGQN